MELHVKKLPKNTDDMGFRKMAGARHIVDSQLKQDNLKGTLTGEGRMKIRLTKDETLDKIKENFLQKGVVVETNKVLKTGRRPIVT